MNITSHELQPNHSTKPTQIEKTQKKSKKTQLKEMKQETPEVDNTGASMISESWTVFLFLHLTTYPRQYEPAEGVMTAAEENGVWQLLMKVW